jgi:uncharacterized DUF497 family protein
VIYEWDSKKAKANLRKQGVSFEEAATVFLDPFAVTYPDPDHSDEKIREITIGRSAKQRVVFLSHTRRGERTRVISGRKATKGDCKQYEERIGEEKQ